MLVKLCLYGLAVSLTVTAVCGAPYSCVRSGSLECGVRYSCLCVAVIFSDQSVERGTAVHISGYNTVADQCGARYSCAY